MCDARAVALKHISIAYGSIKQKRASTFVPCSPGGRVYEYVPFYFAPRSPMLYAIHTGFVHHYTGGQSEIIYLVSSVSAVSRLGLRFVFTDGHPIVQQTRFFNDLAQLVEVDWNVMKQLFWHNTLDDPDRKRRRQAEFLIHQFCPWQAIERIAVYDGTMQSKVQSILVSATAEHQPPVSVERDWYY